jgi:multimeric flavodoxin WrbA
VSETEDIRFQAKWLDCTIREQRLTLLKEYKEEIGMKILGLVCGRKMGNSEILVKEALMGAEELGADVEILRLMDLTIKPCTGCESCMVRMQKREPAECVIKDDDMLFLVEKFRSDGVIVGAPVYFLGPPGYLKVVTDRMLPHWVNYTLEAAKAGEKRRVGGIISVGGGDHSWVPMGLSLMKVLTFTELFIVDQLRVTFAARPGQVLLDEKLMGKARNLGRNVVKGLDVPIKDRKFLGDDPGFCPVCQSDLLIPGKKSLIECAICGARGTLKVDRDKITMIVHEESLKITRTTLEGRLKHFSEIREVHEAYYAKKNLIEEKLEKYRLYKSYTLPSLRPGGFLNKGGQAKT